MIFNKTPLKSKIMVTGSSLLPNKSPTEIIDRPQRRNIISNTLRQCENRKSLNSSQQSQRKKELSESFEYCSRSKKESLYRDSMFVLYKIAPHIQIQVSNVNTCLTKVDEPEVKKCSKFFIRNRQDGLPLSLLNQMSTHTKEPHSILRTPYSKGYQIFKEHINRSKDFLFVKRKYSEYK
jgi:hypothetical protein